MDNMEILFDAILCWFEEAFEDWGSIDDPDWIVLQKKNTEKSWN